jgi:membrane protein implicated in regulation of membrane protease activity
MRMNRIMIVWILSAALLVAGGRWLASRLQDWNLVWLALVATSVVVLMWSSHRWHRRRERQRILSMRDSALW